ncbi:MAG: DMT family transporter [Alphaproteobacteria bacterium]|nr:DMT family transporter [Rhodospirillaceae bacterium]MBT6513010.1 DMT family transporter [Rhodospirillaceae bacterium]MBT7647098.1 DMT family transporter [Rhodospirillaceae bacterium]MDG2479926.1 DMT family transporter [Alphaproteobacteria bacterium]
MRHPRFILICFFVFVSAGCWGLYWLPQRLLVEAGMTGGWGTVAQWLICLAVLLPIAIWRLMKGQQIGLRYWACGVLLGSGAMFYANSFLLTDVVRALVFFYLAPLWATLFEVVFLKRRPARPRAVSITLALSGVWIAVGLDVGLPVPSQLGDWFGLFGGVLIAAGAVRTEIDQPQDVFPLLFMVVVFCIVSSAFQYPFMSDVIGTIPTLDAIEANLPFLLVLVVVFVLPTTAFVFWAPQQIGTGIFGILILSELVVGVISAALLTDEPFGWREAIGTTLVVLAGIVEVAMNRSQGPVGQLPPMENAEKPG